MARVRTTYGSRSAGHAGTLDPFATGLLVVLTGSATRLARFVSAQAKTYVAVARLGRRTATDDCTGEVCSESEGPWPAGGEVAAVLEGMVGTGWQRPPAYSAKRVAGVRSYALARRGEAVALEPVQVTIEAMTLEEYAPPLVRFRCTVSAGTYVRAIARDLGDTLGPGASLEALRRVAVGSLRVEDAIPLDALTAEQGIRPAGEAIPDLPRVVVTEEETVALRQGRVIHPAPGSVLAPLGGMVALVGGASEGEHLIAVGENLADGRVQPRVVLAD